MDIKQSLLNGFKEFMVERPVRHKTPADILAHLEASGHKVATRFNGAPDLPRNRSAIRHIVGIERWGQNRLRVALGQPLVIDEMDGYVPSESTGWEELKAGFVATRQETVQLAREVIKAGALDKTVQHNQFGDITVRGWLNYLRAHASREGLRVR